MCWVIPPASPATTSVSRIASSSEVLPWSTWPMIVTTGGRSTRSSSESSWTGSSTASSAALTISTLRSSASASTVIVSSESVWVRVAISPSCISCLITSALPTPKISATSRTVAPEGILSAGWASSTTGPSGGSSSKRAAAASSAAARRAPRRRVLHLVAARRLRVDHDPAALLLAGAVAGGLHRAHRLRLAVAGGLRLRLALRRGRLGLGLRLALRLRGLLRLRGRGRGAAAVDGFERLQRVGLLDARGGGLGLDPGGVQRREDLLAGQAAAPWRSHELACGPT